MSCASARDYETAAGVAVVYEPDHLTAFLETSCAAAIWHRTPAAEFQSWIHDLLPSSLPEGRIVLRPEAVGSAIEELCQIAETPSSPHKNQLIDDISALSDVFARLMQTQYLRLRLQRVTSNACRKFHVDAIVGRLVCTYRGAGTQFGTSANGGDPTRVLTVPTGAPILLRGSLWPETPASGLLHRSPPIEGTGETRLVLVLDAVDDIHDGQ